MASLKSQRNRNTLSRIASETRAFVAAAAVDNGDDETAPPAPKRLIFDDEDTDAELSDHQTSGTPARRASSDIRKRIDFGSSDEDESKDPVPLPEDPTPLKTSTTQNDVNQDVTEESPPKTRSGRIYKRGLNYADLSPNTPKTRRQPCPVRLKLLQEDLKKGKENKPMEPAVKKCRLSAENLPCPAPLPELKSPTLSAPPPLNYVKRPISRLSLLDESDGELPNGCDTPLRKKRNRRWQKISETPPAASLHSPPVQGLHQMKLFDNSPEKMLTSPWSAPKPRILFDETGNLRRMSAPLPGVAAGGDAIRKRKRVANINPFAYSTPKPEDGKKCNTQGTSQDSEGKGKEPNTPEEPCDNKEVSPEAAANQFSTPVASNSKGNPGARISIPDTPGVPGKRIRVSDVNINRYVEEFIELSEIASGTYGRVALARHRLDGVVYAVKMSKNQIYGQTHEERVIMNEIFAHSALMRHKHIVRYYNSWAENGRVFIQNEFCEGGSLSAKIEELKKMGKRFSEQDLKKILLHVSKGLLYLHNKCLVHLDIKPDNIFISMERMSASSSPSGCDEMFSEDWAAVVNAVVNAQTDDPDHVIAFNMVEESEKAATARNRKSSTGQGNDGSSQPMDEHFSGRDSTDSGNVSDNRPVLDTIMMDEGVIYKIGDLGHVISVDGDHHPEEGDCRYMAPELLSHGLNRQILYKSDVFSLGLSLYEAASMIDLPKNSLDNPMYEFYKAGELPPLEGYSKALNTLIKAMVNPDPLLRPTVQRIVNICSFKSSNVMKNKAQLCKELRETRARLKLLEQALSEDTSAEPDVGASPSFPTPPKEQQESSGDSGNVDEALKEKEPPVTYTKMWLRNKPKAKEVKETPVVKRTNLRKRTLSKNLAGKEGKTRS